MTERAFPPAGAAPPVRPCNRRCRTRPPGGPQLVLHLLPLLLLGLLFATPALAQNLSLPAFSSKPALGGGQTYTLSVQTLLMLTALSFLPSVLLLMTSFTRIIIVLSLLRQALGVQSTPSNQVLIGIALFLTLFVMSPVLDRIYTEAYQPFAADKIPGSGAAGGAPSLCQLPKCLSTASATSSSVTCPAAAIVHVSGRYHRL